MWSKAKEGGYCLEWNLEKSYIWNSTQSYRQTMQARGTDASLESGNYPFAKWLLQLGDEKLPKCGPSQYLITRLRSTVLEGWPGDSLIWAICLSLANADHQFLSERTILAPTNKEKLKINNTILEGLPWELTSLGAKGVSDRRSSGSIRGGECLSYWVLAYAHTMWFADSKVISTKVRCPIILLLNIDDSFIWDYALVLNSLWEPWIVMSLRHELLEENMLEQLCLFNNLINHSFSVM